jgi:hypothetical protein
LSTRCSPKSSVAALASSRPALVNGPSPRAYAATLTCAAETAADFASQCAQQDEEFQLDLSFLRLAVEIWGEQPQPSTEPLLRALEELLQERERHSLRSSGNSPRIPPCTSIWIRSNATNSSSENGSSPPLSLRNSELPHLLGSTGKPQGSLTASARGEGVPSMFDSLEVKILYQPDGGEG